MIRFLPLLFLFFIFSSFKSNFNFTAHRDPPVMTFDSLSINFGTVLQGTLVEKEFHFTNTGKSVLVISTIMASDGGGTADCDKKVFKPGEPGIIKMRQITSGRIGPMDKVATIVSNNRDGNIVIHLIGKVIVP